MKIFSAKLFLILFLCHSSLIIYSQANKYTVLTKTGNVYLFNLNNNKFSEIKIGDSLSSPSKIKIGLNGYIVLVDTNYQSVELKDEGIYNISDLDTLFTMKNNSITENITKFILSEMTTNEDKFKEMKTLGAVVRQGVDKVVPARPKFGNTIDTIYNFVWHPFAEDTSYIFKLFNNKGNTLFMKEINDTLISVNLAKFNLQYDQKYFWKVFLSTSDESNNDSITFILTNPKQRQTILDEVKTLKEDFLIQNSSYNNLLVAKYLTSKNLNEYAINYFEKAIKLNPDENLYWLEYIEFLLDLGLTNEAISAWNKSPFNKLANAK